MRNWSTRFNDQVPTGAPHEHRIGELPRKKKDCVVCSDRTIPVGQKRAHTECEGCRVGVHLKCLDLLDHKTKKKKTVITFSCYQVQKLLSDRLTLD